MIEKFKGQHKVNSIKIDEYQSKIDKLEESNKSLEKEILNSLTIYSKGSVVKFKGVHLN